MVFGFGLSLTAINTLSAVQRAINILTEAGDELATESNLILTLE